MNCTVLMISTVTFHDGKLDKAFSQMPQLPPHFNEACNAAKTFVFLAASLLKVKKLQPFPGKLVVRPEADSNDLYNADDS